MYKLRLKFVGNSTVIPALNPTVPEINCPMELSVGTWNEVAELYAYPVLEVSNVPDAPPAKNNVLLEPRELKAAVVVLF
jgi:hypothetical protein